MDKLFNNTLSCSLARLGSVNTDADKLEIIFEFYERESCEIDSGFKARHKDEKLAGVYSDSHTFWYCFDSENVFAGLDPATVSSLDSLYNGHNVEGYLTSNPDSKICNLVANVSPTIIGFFVMMINSLCDENAIETVRKLMEIVVIKIASEFGIDTGGISAEDLLKNENNPSPIKSFMLAMTKAYK